LRDYIEKIGIEEIGLILKDMGLHPSFEECVKFKKELFSPKTGEEVESTNQQKYRNQKNWKEYKCWYKKRCLKIFYDNQINFNEKKIMGINQ